MIDDVYVIGVGMHPFQRVSPPMRDMAYTAGKAALDDAGIKFRDVGELYNGYLGGNLLEGISYAKDFGLNNASITHVENASATGSTAFREAVRAVRSGDCEIAMALGFDDMMKMGMSMMKMMSGEAPKIDSSYYPLDSLPCGQPVVCMSRALRLKLLPKLRPKTGTMRVLILTRSANQKRK